MAGLASLASKLASSKVPDVRSAAYLITLNPQTDTPTFAATLQYFPESLSDSKAVNWQTKEIPGGSLPLYQWTSSGERSVSFTAQFSTDVDLIAKENTTVIGFTQSILDRIKNAGQENYNVDIRSAVAWLRSHMLPTYNAKGQAVAPSKLMLYIPNSGIGIAGGGDSRSTITKDSIVCVMTQCEVTYDKFFPSGLPRVVSVSLGFSQLPQYRGLVEFPSLTDAMYNSFNPNSPISVGSGFGQNYLGYKTRFADDAARAKSTFSK